MTGRRQEASEQWLARFGLRCDRCRARGCAGPVSARGEELEEDVAARCEAIRARLVDEARKREVA